MDTLFSCASVLACVVCLILVNYQVGAETECRERIYRQEYANGTIVETSRPSYSCPRPDVDPATFTSCCDDTPVTYCCEVTKKAGFLVTDRKDAIVIAVSVVLSVLVLVVVGITCVVWSRCPLYKMCRVRYGADSEISYSAEKTDESKVKMKMMKPLCPENGAAADTEPKCAAAAANRPESPVEDCSGAAAALVDAGGGPEQA